MQPGSRRMGFIALLILGLLILVLVCMILLPGGVTVSYPHHHQQPPPYRQSYFAPLRYDALRMCAITTIIDGELSDPRSSALRRDRLIWRHRADTYITDQIALEKSHHITAPNYQDMAATVCPTNP